MNEKKKIISIVIITCLTIISCQNKIEDFSKSTLRIEITKENKDSKEQIGNAKKIKYNNNSIMILGEKEKSITLFNIDSKETLIIGNKENKQTIIKYKDAYQNNAETQNKISKYKIKTYPFKVIRDFSADKKNGIYIIELIERNKKLYLYILRFSKDGKLLYKIGENGKIKETKNKSKVTQGFTANKAIQHFYCDENGYLYLVMKSLTKTKFPSTKLKLYVFDNNGELFAKKETIEELLPKITDHSTFIENVKVSPKSKELVMLSSYYKTKTRTNKISPSYKTIYNLSLKNNELKTVLNLKEETKLNQDMFGVTNLNNIFLFANSPLYDPKTFTYNYLFKIIPMEGKDAGKEKGLKTIRTSKEFNEITKYLFLGEKEEIIYCSIYKNKIACQLYI